jgi:Ca2+-binding RTX toxin-like protein
MHVMVMQIVLTNSTGGSNFFDFGFDGDLDVLSASATQVVVFNPSTEAETTITGTGFTFSPLGMVTGGTVTGWTTRNDSGQAVATVTGLNWSALAYQSAVIAVSNDDRAPLDALLSLQPINLDASAYGEPANGLNATFVTSNITFLGSQYGEEIEGGAGNDTIDAGGATLGDRGDTILSSTGADSYVFSNITTADSYLDLVYSYHNAGITAAINGVTNTGRITASGLAHTLVDVTNPLNDEGGGFSLFGTALADSFNITLAPLQWIALYGGRGVDRYTLALTDTGMRIDFSGNWDDWRGATQGAVVNLATGAVANDGYGNAETITLSGTGTLEIFGTLHADQLTGSTRNDSFAGLGGADTIDGGAGFDRVRYDRREIDSGVVVDLGAGTASGTWEGTAFLHRLIAVEHVRGSLLDDTLRGGGAAERLQARDGNDLMEGGLGNDTLQGEAGNDTAHGGGGFDEARIDADLADTTLSFEIRDGFAWLEIGAFGETDLIRSDVEQIVFFDQNIGFGELAGIAEGGPIAGNDGGNNLPGTAANDILLGRAGGDWITPGTGNDLVDGGDGVDMVSYVDALSRLVADLGAGTAVVGTTLDILLSIENITGTIYGDLITGSAGANRIRALGDYDWMVGSGGGDIFEGGTGRDTVAYSSATAGVIASLTTDRGTAGQANGDSYVDVENLTGSSYVDRLMGDGDRNILRGLAGDDFLFGLAGADTIDGGANNDSIDGGADNDRITGGRGNDTILGGTGWDTAIYSGARVQYTVTDLGSGRFSVLHLGGGADGLDVLSGIEVLQFSSGQLFL